MDTEDKKKNSFYQDDSRLLRAVVNKIVYRSEESGFTVTRSCEEDDSSQNILNVVGVFPGNIFEGMTYVARGKWSEHPKYGKQFKAFSVTESRPTTADAIVNYLSSRAVKGIGPSLAQRIVDVFGDETIDIIDNQPRLLLKVEGIGEKKLDDITSHWSEHSNIREVLLFFQKHNISNSKAHKIYKQYGQRAIEIVKDNPYILARDIWGIGFLTADNIASKLGIEKDNPKRIEAGLAYTLKKSSEDGNVYLPEHELSAQACKLLGITDRQLVEEIIGVACDNDTLIRSDKDIYLPILYSDEVNLAHNISERLSSNSKPSPVSPSHIDEILNDSLFVDTNNHQSIKSIRLSNEQEQCVTFASSEKMLVITGGPGCGKTTVLKVIVSLFQKSGLEIKLTAPTGRAAQRMYEVCGLEASTIHRLLKYDPMKKSFVHNSADPLELDVIIIDESSMIDINLASSLFAAIPENARIIVVGDVDQLPSVGPGRVLADFLDIPQMPRVRLTKLFRQADESAISYFAHQVNSNIVPNIPEPDGITKTDAYFLPADTTTEAAELIQRLVKDQIPKKFGFSGSDIMVLSPMNQGELGVINLNKRLQQCSTPKLAGTPTVTVGDIEFRLGDRICQRVNNYNIAEAGVFNGDQGEIVGIDSVNKELFVKLWDDREIKYTEEYLPQLDLAYALTIHRSQGSEIPVVVMALHPSHHILLERQLIYTGITRAKKLLIIVGSRKALATATKNNRGKKRYSKLSPRTSQLIQMNHG